MTPPDDALPLTVTLSRTHIAEAIRDQLMTRARYGDDLAPLAVALAAGTKAATARLTEIVVEVADALAASPEVLCSPHRSAAAHAARP